MIIKGMHISGMGGANRSIKRQRKFFHILGLPGIEELFNGTINLSTAPDGYAIQSYDYFFPEVKFKSFPRKRVEDFGFITIKNLYYEDEVFQNWGYIYLAHSSPHFGNNQMFELLGQKITDFREGASLAIEITDGMMIKV